jgi:hypothetical protein
MCIPGAGVLYLSLHTLNTKTETVIRMTFLPLTASTVKSPDRFHRSLIRLLDGDNLASSVWADTAYRSEANLQLLDRRGLVPPPAS